MCGMTSASWRTTSALASSTLIVTLRYHPAVVAVAAGTPVVAVAYEHKTMSLMHGLGIEDLCVAVERVSSMTVAALADEATRADHWRRMPGVTLRAVDYVERQANSFAHQIDTRRSESSGRSVQDHYLPLGRALAERLVDARRTAANERAAALAERDLALAERDAALTQRDDAWTERDAVTAELDVVRTERDAAVTQWDMVAAELERLRGRPSLQISALARSVRAAVRHRWRSRGRA